MEGSEDLHEFEDVTHINKTTSLFNTTLPTIQKKQTTSPTNSNHKYNPTNLPPHTRQKYAKTDSEFTARFEQLFAEHEDNEARRPSRDAGDEAWYAYWRAQYREMRRWYAWVVDIVRSHVEFLAEEGERLGDDVPSGFGGVWRMQGLVLERVERVVGEFKEGLERFRAFERLVCRIEN
ncbi:hypothetical protein CC80DRAFT_550655 [Byssothecium circinans]|uniref:Uncharacterized protein n=1 Tax=Byssothecium circinans TaxID=147558 RepID=A0A6A5TU21_9PLEO|nr:hypothetical protein CC80DRAFT_550655 [Byssothecium circinans]